MEKPRIFPGGLVSLDEKPCNPSRHLWFVRLFSFVYARLYSSSLELPGFISPPPFFFVVGDVGTPGEDTKRNLEETYSKRRSFVKTFLFLFSPPPPSSSPFHFIRAYVFWIFGSLKNKLKFSSELRLKFRMFRYDSKLVEDLNDWWYFNRLTMTSLILLVTTVFHVWSFYLLLYLFDYTS